MAEIVVVLNKVNLGKLSYEDDIVFLPKRGEKIQVSLEPQEQTIEAKVECVEMQFVITAQADKAALGLE